MIIDDTSPYINLSGRDINLEEVEKRQKAAEAAAEASKPSFTESLTAAFQSNNWVTRSLSGHYDKTDPYADISDYDPILKAQDHGITDEKYLANFKNVDTDKEFRDALAYVKQQQRYDAVLANTSTPTNLLLGLYAGVADPTVIIPAVGIFSAARTGNIAARIGKSAVNLAPAVGTSEALLASGKAEETIPEALTYTMFGSLLGAGLGEAGVSLAKGLKADSVKKLYKHFENDSPPMQNGHDMLDMGAKYVGDDTPQTLEQMAVRGATAGNLTGESYLSPKWRLAQVENATVREASEKLSPSPYTTAGTLEGNARSQNVWSGKQLWLAKDSMFKEEAADIYSKYRSRTVSAGEKPMSRRDFNNAVGNHTFDIEFEPSIKHSIKEVDDLARRFQEGYNKPLYREAVEVGSLDAKFKEKIEKDPGHVTRIWETEKIQANPKGFDSVLEIGIRRLRESELKATRLELENLKSEVSSINERIVLGKGTEADSKKLRLFEDADERLRVLQDDERFEVYAQDIKAHWRNSLTGLSKAGKVLHIDPISTGPFKDRSIPVSNREAREFISNNILDISDRLHNRTAADIELHKAFGTDDFDAVRSKILEEHNQRISDITDPKQLAKADKQIKDALGDLATMWGMVKGTKQMDDAQKLGASFARALTHFNYLTRMGMFIFNNAADIAQPILVHGTYRAFKSAFDSLPLVGINKEIRKARLADIKRSGLAWNYVHSDYIRNSAGLDDIGSRGSLADRIGKSISHTFNKVSLIDRWVDIMQKYDGAMAYQRIIDVAEGRESYTGSKEWLAKLGLDERHLPRIKDQIAKYGDRDGDAVAANFHLWDDKKLAERVEKALRSDAAVNLIENTPGAIPFWAETPIGGVIAQFTKFMMQANRLIMVTPFNQKDRHLTEFVVLSMGLAMLSNLSRDMIQGKEPKTDIKDVIYSAAKRSSIATAFQVVDDKILQPVNFGTARLFDVQPDYAPGSGAEAALNLVAGPTGGMFARGYDIASAVAKGDVTQSTLHKMRGFLPLQNWFGAAYALNEVEKAAAEAFNLRKTKSHKKKEGL